MNEKKTFTYVQGNRKFIVETGEMAKQANGAVLVRFEDTAVLSVAVMSKQALDTDFSLDRHISGKALCRWENPGGFLRREGRPTNMRRFRRA